MRLYRPYIPLKVRVCVAIRQLLTKIEITPQVTLGLPHPTAAPLPGESDRRCLERLLRFLAARAGCEVSDLRLDHDPPLAARPRRRMGLGRKTYYKPAANDPAHLFYRPHSPEFDASHLIKTNVRGDHGQHPDRVLIKRERKRRNKTKNKKRGRLRSRSSFPKGRKLRGGRPWRSA